MKNYLLVTVTVTLLLLLALLTGLCSAADYKLVNSGVRYQYLGEYSVERLNKIMTNETKDFSDSSVTYPKATNAVVLYRVIYPTTVPEKNNKPVEASGLIAVPKLAAGKYPVVSYQHGTVFSKTEVPSFPEQSMETRLIVARFAGQGYIVVAADYIGKGTSSEPDSYMAKNSMIQACLDMLLASKAICSDLGLQQDDLFLSGWSQGAWNTMVFRNRLETLGIPIMATATASTPTDVNLMLSSYINNPNKLDTTWLTGIFALYINSYEQNYGMDGLVSAAIRPQYQQTARDFFNNKIGWEQASKVFPPTVKEFLQPDFAAASSFYANQFFQRAAADEAYRWRYATPSRYYYGKADEVIRPYIGATLPVEYQAMCGGASAVAIDAGLNATHRNTFMFAVLDQKKWFDSFLTGK